LNPIRIFEERTILRRISLRTAQTAILAVMFAVTLSATAEQRQIVSRSSAVYPELAKRMKIAGVVRLDATIDSDGKVLDVKATSGNHMLAPAAEDAVRKWKFTPGQGTSTTQVEVNFAIAQ
jgi:TonB family protein